MSKKKSPGDGKTVVSLVSADPISTLDYAPPGVVEVDANWVILDIAHQNGLTVIVPRWDSPSPDGLPNELYLYLNGTEVFHATYISPLTQPEFRPVIDPKYFSIDGAYRLTYETVTTGNHAYSDPRDLTVRRLPVVLLPEPLFTAANLWGYLNCLTIPPIWELVIVRIPLPTKISWEVDDELHLLWTGYKTLNGSGTALFSHTVIRKLTAQDVIGDYEFRITDFKNFIEPLEDGASVLAVYSIYHKGSLIAKSVPGLVKVDRVIPGESYFCGSEPWRVLNVDR
ncbi:hypothetical protein [Pseudomonas fitomaticsae]|uniref:Uncharacterized protein n=1 Tax=Pseudomonas fitomaticsae TaxID=2837969 RepID=A0ABY3PUC5_9PSED|nr:hypothetical protein [Pseudomonas fitomaticsae]UFP97529.1 hypothetical protein KJY40_15765 [Pseudomonas fitomaticsae]